MQQVTRTANKLLINRPPYMTRQHFIMLADELAHDKVYYGSPISYHEKLERMITYCQASNPKFNIDSFKTRVSETYTRLINELGKKIGSTL